VVALAGVCAELAFFRKHVDGSDADFELVYRLLKGDGEHARALFEYTAQLCREYRDVIDVIATILRAKLYLTGSQIDALVELIRANRGRETTLQ
jgi:hypothetical protein